MAGNGNGLRPLNMVATIGTFDGVHRGHCHLISKLLEVASLRHAESAVFTFSSHPVAVLHPERAVQWLLPLHERVAMLKAMGVDHVVVLDFNTAMASLSAARFALHLREQWGVKTLVMGFNHHFGSDGGASLDTVGDDVEIVRAEEYRGAEAPVSSSIVRSLLARGDVRTAAAKLGRRYSLTGVVVHGNHVGTSLGFPTANVGQLPPSLLVPAAGAYAVRARVDGVWHGGMANVGVRPTVARDLEPTLEVHLFDTEGDFYGKAITVEWVERLRGEQRWPSLEALRARLAEDEHRARDILNNPHY